MAPKDRGKKRKQQAKKDAAAPQVNRRATRATPVRTPRNRSTHKDSDKPTCITFGPGRREHYLTYFFCSQYDQWENETQAGTVGKKKRESARYSCRANHSSWFFPTDSLQISKPYGNLDSLLICKPCGSPIEYKEDSEQSSTDNEADCCTPEFSRVSATTTSTNTSQADLTDAPEIPDDDDSVINGVISPPPHTNTPDAHHTTTPDGPHTNTQEAFRQPHLPSSQQSEVPPNSNSRTTLLYLDTASCNCEKQDVIDKLLKQNAELQQKLYQSNRKLKKLTEDMKPFVEGKMGVRARNIFKQIATVTTSTRGRKLVSKAIVAVAC
jgi:hypothetical protein